MGGYCNKLSRVSSDTGFLSKPVRLVSPQQALPLAIAERYSVIIDFAKYPVGSSVYLHAIAQGDFSSTVREDAPSKPIMKFKIVRTAVDDSSIPDLQERIEPLQLTAKTPKRTFTFERGKNDRWLIKQKEWDIGRIDVIEIGRGGLDPITTAPAQPISKIRPL